MVKEGYKQTEVGVIPVDWEVVELGGILRVCHGKSQREIEVAGGQYPILATGGEIGRTNSFLYDQPSVLIGRKGTIDKPSYKDTPFWTVDTLYYTSIFGAHPKLLFYYFQGISWYDYNEASGVPSLNAKNIESIQIPLPPTLREQRAIARALSDTDALLSALDALIGKKEAFKRGMMEGLLSGERRLEGFGASDWREIVLGDVLTVCHGKNQKDVEVVNGRYPILATGGEIGRTDDFLCDEPSVLIGRKGTIDKPRYMDTPFWTVDTLYYTRIFDADPKYLFYCFKLIPWYDYNEASGVPSLNAKNIESIELSLPPLPEQRAIARVLSDLDAELSALRARRAKLAQVKAGMMGVLLTGAVRLV